MRVKSVIAACIAGAGLASAASGQHAGDIILQSNAGMVETGRADGTGVYFPWHVYSDRFGKQGLPDRTTDPGVNSIPGSFPPNAVVRLHVRRAARKWDTVEQNFCTIPEEVIEIRKGTSSSNWIRTPAADPAGFDGPSVNMGTTDPADGLIHQHPAYWLQAPASDGVYLIELDVQTTGLATSAPVWLVFDQNATDEELDDALAFADATLEHGSGNLCRRRGDFNDDGSVGVSDLFSFLDAWFAEFGAPGSGVLADFDRSGDVTVADLFSFLDVWFAQFA